MLYSSGTAPLVPALWMWDGRKVESLSGGLSTPSSRGGEKGENFWKSDVRAETELEPSGDLGFTTVHIEESAVNETAVEPALMGRTWPVLSIHSKKSAQGGRKNHRREKEGMIKQMNETTAR